MNGSLKGAVEKDASLNTFLNNDYYNEFSSDEKFQIQNHSFNVGSVEFGNADFSRQTTDEKSAIWIGNIGMVSLSDYYKANTNVEQCGNFTLNNNNLDNCKTTNYLIPLSGYFWTITAHKNISFSSFYIFANGMVDSGGAGGSNSEVRPTLYLKSNIKFIGEGTSLNPYAIK